MQVEGDDDGYYNIDDFEDSSDVGTKNNTVRGSGKSKLDFQSAAQLLSDNNEREPKKLPNGNWECNHRCKDKTKCGHACCKEGMNKKPKPPKPKTSGSTQKHPAQETSQSAAKASSDTAKVQSTLKGHFAKKPMPAPVCSPPSPIAQLDLCPDEGRKITRKAGTATSEKGGSPARDPPDLKRLQKLHSNAQKRPPPSAVTSVSRKQPPHSYGGDTAPTLSFLPAKSPGGDTQPESPFGDTMIDDFDDSLDLDDDGGDVSKGVVEANAEELADDGFGDNDSLLEDVMVGLADSQDMIASNSHTTQNEGELEGLDDRETAPTELGHENSPEVRSAILLPRTINMPMASKKERSLFVTDSSSDPLTNSIQPDPATPEGSPRRALKRGAQRPSTPFKAGPSKKAKTQHTLSEADSPGAENITPSTIPPEKATVDDGNESDERQYINKDQSKIDNLKAWFLKEFGDIVEIV
ncbi:hypothetical protein NA57DRAFT_70256 [Rhizodiscina lignyota]|uniref:Uncharacterized protein n=1 Tax=Rhizodiscina lignyota TaxID=1504668 RepID=A0A9P4IM33_9PEZI|nr:hypothetical protein NA57DRAFT_70256 [Rhizodiscina lignyota]